MLQTSQVVGQYMWEVYGERQRGGVCGGVVPLPTGVESGDPGGPSPEKNTNYVQKRLNLVHISVYFCYFNMK